jgi:hypothetical protein
MLSVVVQCTPSRADAASGTLLTLRANAISLQRQSPRIRIEPHALVWLRGATLSLS